MASCLARTHRNRHPPLVASTQEFVADAAWEFPKAGNTKAKNLFRVFDDHRVSATDASKVKATCSEFLGIYGLLRHYVECLMPRTPEHDAAKSSFFAVCEVLDLILAAKFKLAPMDELWRAVEDATVRFLQLRKAVYGDSLLKPKHHWQLDVGRQFRRDGVVLDAFVIQRSHLAVKRVADYVENTRTFEVSLTGPDWMLLMEPPERRSLRPGPDLLVRAQLLFARTSNLFVSPEGPIC